MSTKIINQPRKSLKKGVDSRSRAGPEALFFPTFRNKELVNFREQTVFYHMKDFPSKLKNKLKIVISMSKKFKNEKWEELLELYGQSQLKRETGEGPQAIPEEEVPGLLDSPKLVKISKIVFGRNFSFLFLSNDNFQAIFKDQLEIFFCKENNSVSVTKDNDFDMVYSLNNFIFIDNPNLWKRIAFINRTLKMIQQNQFELDTKSCRIKN